jgi:hypothetical protein
MSDEQALNLTRQGFIKADRLTIEQLEGIVGLIEQGFVGGKATRQHGTSFTQFWRRVQREPELLARVLAYKEKVESESKEEGTPA